MAASLVPTAWAFGQTTVGHESRNQATSHSAHVGTETETQYVAHSQRRGQLLLCGGNVLPKSILNEFHRLGAGEDGNLVIIPTASPRSDTGDYLPWTQIWGDYPWKRISVLHADNRDSANREENVELIRQASAVWITGGEQQRLVERFQNTAVHQELLRHLDRGRIIGGTSAGSAVTSLNMIAEGQTHPVVKKGWGILPGAIIDQHFSQRHRFERLSNAVAWHPKQVGIGIDESTGVLIDRDGARVLGDGSVYFYQMNSASAVEEACYRSGTSLPESAWNKMITWAR